MKVRIKNLDREQYLRSIMQMEHYESIKFSKESMTWWDDFYSWDRFPCLCLEDRGEELCYLFYHIDTAHKYLRIHSLLTPYKHRSTGVATKLLDHLLYHIGRKNRIKRVKIFCLPGSLGFYAKLGIDFWGVNRYGQFYTNFPMPLKGVKSIPAAMKKHGMEHLKLKELTGLYYPA